MSSNVQHEDAWPMHVSSVCLQNIDEKDNTNKLEGSKALAVHRDAGLTERDYIGLSATTSASSSTTQTIFHNLMHLDASKCSDARDKEPECRDTELRLGIGPYKGDASAVPTSQHGGHQVQGVPHQHLFPQNQILKQAVDGSNAQYRCHEGGSGNGSVEFHQSFWPWGPGVAPGRFMIPVPKVSMVPAKRPYLEVMSENNNNKASICTLATNSNTPSEAATLERTNPNGAPPLPTLASSHGGGIGGGGFYAWSCSTPIVAKAPWQHGNCDQDGMVGATLTKNSCPIRALPPPPLFKTSPAPPVSQYDPLPPMMSKSPVAPHLSSSEERASLTPDVHKEDANRNKAPVVGWPPVRSFRKNTLQSTAGLGAGKGSSASSDLRKHEDASKANESVADQQIKGNTKDALFVKAKLDGVRICRKVDLTSYSSYDSLKSALEEMFQGFVCNDNAKLDLLHGQNYVLTHEDKDGDWMLVGDVPWRMFITTVKSLRIMKAVDAVGLGEKVFAKLKAQGMNCKA